MSPTAEGVKLFEDIKNWAALAALAKRGAKPQDESSHPNNHSYSIPECSLNKLLSPTAFPELFASRPGTAPEPILAKNP